MNTLSHTLLFVTGAPATPGEGMAVLPQVIIIVVCLIGTGLFAGLETGVISINRLRLRHLVRNKVAGAKTLQEFLDHPDHLLGTTLVGTNICMVMASVTAASLSAQLFGAWGTWISSVLMALIILIGCEYIPKAWFQGRPSQRTRPFAGVLRYAGLVLYPVSRVIMMLSKALVPAPSPEQQDAQPFITKEELKHLAHESEQSGALTADERRMIHHVLELTHRLCRDIMVSREDIIHLREEGTREELLELARARQLTRFPVFNEDTKRFVGIVHIMDVLRDPEPGDKVVRDYMRPPQFIAEDTPADELLPRMRRSRQPMALVVDQQSEVVGLITIEVVLMEIVGAL